MPCCNAYRYAGKRYDVGSATLDMGARRFGPDISHFLQQDYFTDALGDLGLAEDPSRFSIACRQVGAIVLPDKLPKEESVFSESTSVFFKNTKVIRFYDKKRETLVYVALSRKVIEGSPMNAISTVPIQRWEGK